MGDRNIISSDSSLPAIYKLLYFPDTETTVYGINYCHGRIIYVNNCYIEATFVFYNNYDEAKLDFECNAIVNDSFIVRPWSFSEDEDRNEYVVGFDRFECFLSHNFGYENRLWEISNPLACNPPEVIQELVKELIQAFLYLFSKGIGLKSAEHPKCYVWTGTKIKLVLVKNHISSSDVTPSMWEWIKEDTVSSFGVMLHQYIFGVGGTWIQRDSFLECFDKSQDFPNTMLSPEKRLNVIHDHTFMQSDMSFALGILWMVNRGLKNNRLQDHDIDQIREALWNPIVTRKISPSDDWSIGISDEFRNYLDNKVEEFKQEAKDNKDKEYFEISYQSIPQLISWNRNALEHQIMNEDEIYKHVESVWPALFSILYRLLQHY